MRMVLLMMILNGSLFAGRSIMPTSRFGSAPVQRVALYERTLYTAQTRGPLTIYDVSNPAEARYVGALPLVIPHLDHLLVDEVTDIDVDGDRLYVALGNRGLNIYDLSDPFHPRFLKNLRFDTAVRRISADGTRVALDLRPDGVWGQTHVLDLSDHICNVAKSRYRNERQPEIALFNGLLLIGTEIFDTSRASSFGIMDPVFGTQRWTIGGSLGILRGRPHQLYELTSTFGPKPGYSFTKDYDRFAIFGDVVLAFRDDEMTVYDVESLRSARPRYSIPVSPSLDQDYGSGLLVRAMGESGFQLIDLDAQGETFSHPVLAGAAHGVSISEGLAFVAHGDGGLRIFDIRNPGAPVYVGGLGLHGSVKAVAITNGIAYAATGYGLEWVDVSAPDRPTALGRLALDANGGGADTVLLTGALAVLHTDEGYSVVDITDPAAPKIRSTIHPTSFGLTDAASWRDPILEIGRVTYAGAALGGLKSYDLSDPDHPVLLPDQIQLGAADAFVHTDQAFYGLGELTTNGRFDVVDLTRDVPALVHREQIGSVYQKEFMNTPDMVKIGDRLIAGGGPRLWIFDISNPTSVELLDSIPFSGRVTDLEVWEDRLFAADAASGQVVEYSLEAPPRLVIPWLVDNVGFGSKLILHNGSNLAQEVTLKAVSRTGETRERQVVIAARGVFAARSESLFPGLSGYSLTVHALTQHLYGSFLITNREAVSGGNSPSQTTAASLDQLSAELVFGYVPGDQTAAVVLLSPDGRGETPVTLTLHDQIHGKLAETRVQLVDQRPTATLVADLFPQIQIPLDATLTARVAEDRLIAGTTFVFNALRQPSMTSAFPVTPTELTLVEETGLPRYRHLTEPHEDTVYAACGSFGIEVVDLASGAPEVVARLMQADDVVWRVHRLGTRTLVALTLSHLITYDLTDPHAPRELDRFILDNVDDLVVYGDWIYLVGTRRLWVVDARDPGQLALRSDRALDGSSPADPRVAAANGRLYVNHFNFATGQNHLSAYSLADPAYPQPIITHKGEGRYRDMVASGDLVALNGPVVWDFSQPDSPVKVFERDRDYRWLEFDGQVLWQDSYIHDTESYDFSAGLEDPVITTNALGCEHQRFYSVQVVDGVLYGGGRGLRVIDTHAIPKRAVAGFEESAATSDDESLPSSASLKALLAKTADPDLDILRRLPVGQVLTYWTHGDLILVGYSAQLYVIKAPAGEEPCLWSILEPGYFVSDVIFHGDHIYAKRYSTLIGYDLSDPALPRLTGQKTMLEATSAVQVVANRLETTISGSRTLFYRMERSEHLIPWVVDNDAFTSRVALYHQGGRPAKVTMTATDREGRSQSATVTVAPRAVLSFAAGDLFPDLTGYSLRLVSNRPNLYVSFMTINQTPASGGNSPSQTTAAPVETLTSQLLFGFVPGDEIAALVLTAGEVQVDPNRTVQVSLQLHDETGVIATSEITLTGNQPLAVTATALFGTVPQNAVIRAVALDGTPIAGTTFVFNTLGQPSMARSISLKP